MTESEFQQVLMANLERIRGRFGLTIVEFSKLCGVTPRAYYWWLTGTMPGVYHLYRLRESAVGPGITWGSILT